MSWFSLRCWTHLPQYSLKLTATALVAAFNKTPAPSNRKKRSKERDGRQVTSALVHFTTNCLSMHIKIVGWWKWDGVWQLTHHNGWLRYTTGSVSKAHPSLQTHQLQLEVDWLLNLYISTTRPSWCSQSECQTNHKLCFQEAADLCLLLACLVKQSLKASRDFLNISWKIVSIDLLFTVEKINAYRWRYGPLSPSSQ